MSDRNGDGLPLYAAVKANRLRSHRLGAEIAMSRLRKAPPDVHAEHEDVPPEPADDNEQEGEE
jgi:hypothetical protein